MTARMLILLTRAALCLVALLWIVPPNAKGAEESAKCAPVANAADAAKEEQAPADTAAKAPAASGSPLKSGKLEAGAMLKFEFPDLPPVLRALDKNEKYVTAFLAARLPENYTLERKFPLFVYIEGGSGLQPGQGSRGSNIVENRDFIVVSMPLFKNEPLDRTKAHNGIMILQEDFDLISRCHRVMLSALLDVVPNIDAGHGVIGGFSNGGHTMAVLLTGKDEFTLKNFDKFLFIEGGLRLRDVDDTVLANKRVLMMMGENGMGKRMEKPHEREGWTYVTMPGVGHAFPVEYQANVREWLRATLADK